MFPENLLNLIFPSVCLNCRKGVKSGDAICENCFGAIPLHRTLFCGKCRGRLPDNRKTCHKDSKFMLGSATDYGNETAKNLIHGLKFQYLKPAAVPLAELLINYAGALGFSFKNYSVVPIPLSGERLRSRGFNQSGLIAEIFANRFGLPLDTTCLARTKNTKPQSDTKNLAERKQNVDGCFEVKNAAGIMGKNVILIDDVVTSGVTLTEAASALKSAGAKRIIALTAARA